MLSNLAQGEKMQAVAPEVFLPGFVWELTGCS
jgi:hypothetical protein